MQNEFISVVSSRPTLGKISLAQPDPYAGGEGLVTCCTRSCSAVAYRPAPIRLQLFCVAMVTRGRNNRALSFNIARLLGCMIDDRQARAAQYKPNVTSRKTDNYCIPAGQLRVQQVTRPSPPA